MPEPLTASTVNRAIRKHVFPVLRAAKFDKVSTGTSYRWSDDAIWMFGLSRMTTHFREVTGWPRFSMSAGLGVSYPWLYDSLDESKRDKTGRLLLKYGQHHFAMGLSIGIEQRHHTAGLSSQESTRDDIWWVSPDGCNLDDVAGDIARQFEKQGIPFLDKTADLDTGYEEKRAYLPPDTDAVSAYIDGASPSGARWWLDQNLRFAEKIGRHDDANDYRKLIDTL